MTDTCHWRHKKGRRSMNDTEGERTYLSALPPSSAGVLCRVFFTHQYWQFPVLISDASNVVPPSLGSFWAEAVAKRVTQPLVRTTPCTALGSAIARLSVSHPAVSCYSFSIAKVGPWLAATIRELPPFRLRAAYIRHLAVAVNPGREPENKLAGRICHGSYQLSGFDRWRPC